MHGVIIPSIWYFGLLLKAILPDSDGVITSFYCILSVSFISFAVGSFKLKA